MGIVVHEKIIIICKKCKLIYAFFWSMLESDFEFALGLDKLKVQLRVSQFSNFCLYVTALKASGI